MYVCMYVSIYIDICIYIVLKKLWVQHDNNRRQLEEQQASGVKGKEDRGERDRDRDRERERERERRSRRSRYIHRFLVSCFGQCVCVRGELKLTYQL
jgi:hypothetical protein